MRGVCALLVMLSLVISAQSPGFAMTPEEQLANPQLEARARDLSAQLRCLVCQNQSIEDSDADLAKDLRREVRLQLTQGLSDAMILDNLQRTYGDYILLKPPIHGATYVLWGAPVAMVGLGLGLFVLYRRQRGASDKPDQRHAQRALQAEQQVASPRLLLGIGLSAIMLTIALYSYLGRPDLAAQPLTLRSEERLQAALEDKAQQTRLQEALTLAEQAVLERPQSVEAHLSLALAYARLDDFGAEIAALREALRLSDNALVIKSMLAEALSRQADGQITLPARALIAEVLALMPDEPRALFMAGLAAYQDEAYQLAIDRWSHLQKSAPRASQWADIATRNIAQAAEKGGITLDESQMPTLDGDSVDAIASASQEEQQEMIAAMVAGLEARLADAPDDPDGWQRLVQARRVLGESEALWRALSGAARAQPDNRDAQLEVLEALLAGADTAAIAIGQEALDRLAIMDSEALEYLFFAGHIARLKGDTQAAITAWQSLYDKIGDDRSGFKETLGEQIAALK